MSISTSLLLCNSFFRIHLFILHRRFVQFHNIRSRCKAFVTNPTNIQQRLLRQPHLYLFCCMLLTKKKKRLTCTCFCQMLNEFSTCTVWLFCVAIIPSAEYPISKGFLLISMLGCESERRRRTASTFSINACNKEWCCIFVAVFIHVNIISC